MNRAFVSLYIIVVLSIVLLGIALNSFWDSMNASQDIDTPTASLINIIENNFENKITNDEKIDALSEYNNSINYKIALKNIDDFSATDVANQLKNGKIVRAVNKNQTNYYKIMTNKNDVLLVSFFEENHQQTPLYICFIIIFYLSIGVVVFLWVWPISRDLSRLAQHTKTVGKQGIPSLIKISTRSILFPFAEAFNSMTYRLSELLSTQKEMTYAVSHELRTPLARMKFALAITDETASAEELKKQYSSIEKDIADMESLINTLLLYAQFEQQSQTLKQEKGYIQDLLIAILQRDKTMVEGALNISIEDQSHGEIYVCEWSLMQTALQNLLSNAKGYARANICITLKTNESHYFIQVEDDGIGIPEDQRERIFESFVRLYSESTNRSGFGLGLAIVKRIMGWHKGVVRCGESRWGGSLFELTWEKPA